MNRSELEQRLKREYGQPGVFCRDTLLPPDIIKLYEVGMFLCEPTYCDATFHPGGMLAPHRFQIISANARCIDALSTHPEWGLCIWPRNTRFKVIDRVDYEGRTQILLLDIPDDLLDFFSSPECIHLERSLIIQARDYLRATWFQPPAPALDNDLWRSRLIDPIGFSDDGIPFECPR